MKVYLIRHGEVNPDGTIDPPLSERGHAQAKAVGRRCQEWGVQLLCVSTMLRAQQTADEIQAVSSIVPRLNLTGLEEVYLGDLDNLDCERVVDALSYIRAFTEAENFNCVAIIAHGGTIMMSLLHWLGLDLQVVRTVRFGFSNCGSTKVVLGGEVPLLIEWVNRG